MVARTRRTSKGCCLRLRSIRSQLFKGELMLGPCFLPLPLPSPPSCHMELMLEARMPINDFHVLVAQARHEATSIGLKVSRPARMEGDDLSVARLTWRFSNQSHTLSRKWPRSPVPGEPKALSTVHWEEGLTLSVGQKVRGCWAETSTLRQDITVSSGQEDTPEIERNWVR